MSETLERVARADARFCNRDFDGFSKADKRRYMERAAVMVKALRDPENSTVINGLMALVEKISEMSSPLEPVEDGQILTEEQAANRYMNIGAVMRNGREVEAAWRAMIDSILSGAKE